TGYEAAKHPTPADRTGRSRTSRGGGVSIEGLDHHVTEFDRVAVAGESEETACAILARVCGIGHVVTDLAEVGIDDDRPIQFNLDLRALDGAFLEVPFTDRPEVAALRRHHTVGRAAILPRVELGILVGGVVEDLQLAHADIGGIPLTRVSDRQPV